MRRLLVGTAALLLAGCAGAQKPALCSARTQLHADAVISPKTWFALLLHGYDPERNEVPRTALDCVGTPIVLEAAGDACGDPIPAEPPPTTAKLSAADVVQSPAGPNRYLVWVMTRRLPNGEALGPVALVDASEQALAVRALGTLRAPASNATLRLEKVGSVTLLVAESESCGGESSLVCKRMARLVPLRQSRFISEPLLHPDGSCAGPATLWLRREKTQKLKNGSERRSELVSNVLVANDSLVIEERMAVKDFEPKQPTGPVGVQSANVKRTIRVLANKLVVDAPSLWSQLEGGAQ